MKSKDLILIGGGGHCKSCINVITASDEYRIKGIIDTSNNVGKSVVGHSIIATDEDIPSFINDGYSFLITIGHMGNGIARNRIFSILNKLKAKMPVIKSPNAIISESAKIGKGSIIMHNVILNSDSSIGENCIINNNSLVEHDSVIGYNSHISTGALVNGACNIGDECFIGSGAILRNNISISSHVILGMGSIATKSIKIPGTYAGNPAKSIIIK